VTPEPVAIDVVLVPLVVPPTVRDDAYAILDDGERERVLQRAGVAADRFVVAHAAARLVVGARIGVDAARVEFATEPHGRPIISGCSFSLSHAGDRAAIATGIEGLRLGIDIEIVRDRIRLDRLARRVFDRSTYEQWRTLGREARLEAFFARWTAVEAVLKARGTGVAGGIDTALPPPGWTCEPFAGGRGYASAVAADLPAIAVTVRELDVAGELTR
jgi:4'-phosphopantetheinyl transferase